MHEHVRLAGNEDETIGVAFRPVRRTVIKVSYAFVDSDLAGFENGEADMFVIEWSTYF